MTLAALPIFLRLGGRPVMLIGDGEAAEAKRRLLDRAGAVIVGEGDAAALAIVVGDDAAVARLRARGVLVNAVDRPDLCDFTLPAIVERGDVVVAIGTGGVSAGLAAALRQRVEAWLPASVGVLARALHDARDAIRARWPDTGDRRRAIGAALAPGGALDPVGGDPDIARWLATAGLAPARLDRFTVASSDPDDLSLAAARALAQADRVYHDPAVAPAILARARADAVRIAAPPPADPTPGNNVHLEVSR